MKRTHAYKTKGTADNLYTSGKRFLLNFINRNADVFEALARQATPFGDNWLPAKRFAAQVELTNSLRGQ
jgi:hypothetical protein